MFYTLLDFLICVWVYFKNRQMQTCTCIYMICVKNMDVYRMYLFFSARKEKKCNRSTSFLPFYLEFYLLSNQSNLSIKVQRLNKNEQNFPFFDLGFLSRTFTIHRTAGKVGGFNSSQPLPPTSQTLKYQPGDYCREFTSTHSQQPDSNREPLVSDHKSLTTKFIAKQDENGCYKFIAVLSKIPNYTNSAKVNKPDFWATSDILGMVSNFSGVEFMINLIFFYYKINFGCNTNVIDMFYFKFLTNFEF